MLQTNSALPPVLAVVGQPSNSSNLQVWADDSTDDEVLGMVVRTGKLHDLAQDIRTGKLLLLPACMHSYFLAMFLLDSSSALLLYLVMM